MYTADCTSFTPKSVDGPVFLVKFVWYYPRYVIFQLGRLVIDPARFR